MKIGLISAMLFVVSAVILLPLLVIGIQNNRVTVNQDSHAKEQREDINLRVFNAQTGKIMPMYLEEYLKGVVAAEMPAQFEMEALKAQAVAARTYAVKNLKQFGGNGDPNHSNADISTDPHDGQAWVNEAMLKEKWGKDFTKYWPKIVRAIEETRGIIVTYQGKPIHAVFHSTSGERTASAKEVWGFDYPYLQSVACSWDKESPRYSENREITLSELEEKLGIHITAVAIAANESRPTIAILDLTPSGRVDRMRFGDKIITGNEVREKIGLKSTQFTVSMAGGKVQFNTTGYGHGVGLCQYGANGLAKQGKNYQQILAYYYTGIACKNIGQDKVLP